VTPPDSGIRPEEAFELLGHETRLAILNALWEASRGTEEFDEPGEPEPWYPGADAVSFSELRKSVGMSDGSQFNYHLGKLVGRFVHRTDDGYVLGRTGQRIISIVRAREFTEETTFEGRSIDEPCPLCGGELVLETGTERTLDFLFWLCRDCDGVRRVRGIPSGVLGIMDSLSPAGFHNRTLEEAIRAMVTWTIHRQTMAVQGVCPDCTGPTETSLIYCEDHENEGDQVCDSCRTVFGVRFLTICEVCHLPWVTPSERRVLVDPTVIAFYRDHGYEPRDLHWPPVSTETVVDQTVVSEDPIRIRVTIALDGNHLEVVLDETGAVIRCERTA